MSDTEGQKPADPIIGRDKYQDLLRVQALRKELNELGYHVLPKDHVRKFGATQAISIREWYRLDDEMRRRIEQRTIEDMARRLGHTMVKSGAIKHSMETQEEIGRCYRIEAAILLRDPTFDNPEWLNERVSGDPE